MYYSGMPFNEYNEIKSIISGDSYFIRKNTNNDIFAAVYERLKDNVIFQVVYEEVDFNSDELLKYHNEHYGILIPFFVQNLINDRIYKIATFLRGSIKGFRVIKYDNIWRDLIEEIYDENSLLVEYRKLIYESDQRLPSKEKIFFASSWHISEEIY